MNDVLQGISVILSGGWKLLTETTVPGTDFSFGMLLVMLACVPIGFRLLSVALGFNVGHISSPVQDYGTKGSKRYRVSAARKNDTH